MRTVLFLHRAGSVDRIPVAEFKIVRDAETVSIVYQASGDEARRYPGWWGVRAEAAIGPGFVTIERNGAVIFDGRIPFGAKVLPFKPMESPRDRR